jgi:hypothetical protein
MKIRTSMKITTGKACVFHTRFQTQTRSEA